MSDSGGGAEEGPFRYHLELTPAQLKITHTALHSLLDDLGHDEADVVEIVREVLAKLPDDHAIRAIRLQGEPREEPLGGRADSDDDSEGSEGPPDISA